MRKYFLTCAAFTFQSQKHGSTSTNTTTIVLKQILSMLFKNWYYSLQQLPSKPFKSSTSLLQKFNKYSIYHMVDLSLNDYVQLKMRAHPPSGQNIDPTIIYCARKVLKKKQYHIHINITKICDHVRLGR